MAMQTKKTCLSNLKLTNEIVKAAGFISTEAFQKAAFYHYMIISLSSPYVKTSYLSTKSVHTKNIIVRQSKTDLFIEFDIPQGILSLRKTFKVINGSFKDVATQ